MSPSHVSSYHTNAQMFLTRGIITKVLFDCIIKFCAAHCDIQNETSRVHVCCSLWQDARNVTKVRVIRCMFHGDQALCAFLVARNTCRHQANTMEPTTKHNGMQPNQKYEFHLILTRTTRRVPENLCCA